MRRNATAQSKARRQDETGVSLFPFLAVLICTMGVLIILLVVIARNARAQAAEEARTKTVVDEQSVQQAREDSEWRMEQLRASLVATQSQLANSRLELGHLEEHSRQLRNELAEMEKTWQQLDEKQAGPEQRRAVEERLAGLQSVIAEAERRVVEAQRQARQRSESYAIVPYEGPNGTRRRPMYVECRANSVILQPEGVILTPSDFEGPGGPENPLAAALRAEREYLLQRGALDSNAAGEPYPLLLVRESGIDTYNDALDVIKSWGSDFGFEFVNDGWKLDFPSPDPQLAETLRREIDLARQRQQRLIEAAPRHFQSYRAGDGGRSQYTVSSGRGGVVPYGNVREAGAGKSSFGDNDAGDASGEKSNAATNAPRRPGEWRPSPPSGKPSAEDDPTKTPEPRPDSVAKSRGRDWALRDEMPPNSTPLARPIRIECHHDRLVLVSQEGRAGGKTIPLGTRTKDSLKDLVLAVWAHADSWGIAGERMYWRPILNVYVSPGGEQRFSDLDALLEGSGLTVERKQ